ncbi:hypothetical protein OESDEN_01423 [Oesophagostomum dentatum]|uniref:Uncharacterized protein n=1 Tax=Oesophagostomum dentatum TaxID=61180 RepID=A0A0B1TRY8_OESDE|nr:hypothetical protein OESDEN_01423 [Oesophagostomum dentatum]
MPDIHAVQKRKVKCYNCGGPHYRSTCPLLLLPAYQQLKEKYHCRLVTEEGSKRAEFVANLREQFAEVFKCELGRCTKTEAKLVLKDNAIPIFKKKRPVPYASVPDLDKEIDRLVGEGVISAVDHSEWVAPIVVVRKKNSKIRLRAHFSTGLNDALQLQQHPLPTVEEVFTKLDGGQLFTQIYFAEAYLQVEVEEESKETLTINAHRGLFRYNRLPFGVKSAPGIFQQIMNAMICGLEGVAVYLDDIQYLGYIIDKDGRHPDPEKNEVIRQMPVPKNVQEVRSFLGMVSCYGSFIAEMRRWNKECEAAFNRAKEVIASDLLLTHFDPSLLIIVAADASDYGIGATVLHKVPDGTEKAICHASRSLTPAEMNYGQIEKEELALIFAVRKFHRYIYGRRFKLMTGHKPLLHIFRSKKMVPAYTANRLQRWKLILLGYDFDLEYPYYQLDYPSKASSDRRCRDSQNKTGCSGRSECRCRGITRQQKCD